MIEHTVGDLLADKVELDVEGIDRIYLNAISPGCRRVVGWSVFFASIAGRWWPRRR